MLKILLLIATVALFVHGLIHLMGTTSYLRLAEVQGLPFKTTVLSGRWDLGESGITFFGVLWTVAAIGFVLAAIAFYLGWGWWQPVLITVTLVSLVITALDWNVAYAGVMINLAILLLLALGPRISAAFAA